MKGLENQGKIVVNYRCRVEAARMPGQVQARSRWADAFH